MATASIPPPLFKELFFDSLTSCENAKMTDNLYFSKNPIKRYFFRKNLKNVLKAILLSKNRKLAMDFGPGFGILIPPLSKVFERVMAIDIDEGQLSACKKVIDASGIMNIELVLKKKEDEFDEMQSNYWDCIVADNVLEHDIGARDIIDNLSRILKIGGVLVVSLPSENWIYRLFESKNDGHVFRTKAEIEDLISHCRSSLEEISKFDVFPFWKTRVYAKKRG